MMPAVSFANLLVVAVIAFAAPFLLGLFPRVRLPSVVVEIIAGILVGPAALGWVRVDLPVQILSILGLAFLLFLAGMEIDLERLRGQALRLAGLSLAASAILALVAGYAAFAIGLVRSPLLIGIILLATSLGLVIPVLKDAGEAETPFGQLVIAAATVADFGAVILLSLFFSREAISPIANLILLVGFVALLAVRGLPALLYRGVTGGRRIVAAALLQATSLPFIVAAAAIGLQLRLISPASSAALVGAGLLSVVVFPVLALTLLRYSRHDVAATPALQSAQTVHGAGGDG